MLTATAAIQDRASLFGWVEASLPENAGYGASVRSQQLGELCSLLVRAIRVSGRLPRGLAQAPWLQVAGAEGHGGESLLQKNPVGAAWKHKRRLRTKQGLYRPESIVMGTVGSTGRWQKGHHARLSRALEHSGPVAFS